MQLYCYLIVLLQAISKLIDVIKKKLEVEEKDISKVNRVLILMIIIYNYMINLPFVLLLYISPLQIAEFKLLSSKCNSDDSIVSTSACQALIVLVEIGLWDVKSALASFMACLSSSKYVHAY